MAKDTRMENGANGADPNRYRTLANMVAYARALRTGESADGSLEEAFIYVNLVANEGREADIRYVLSDSLGFGGHNASIVLKRYED